MKKQSYLLFLFIILLPYMVFAFEIYPIAKFNGNNAIILKEGIGYYYEKTRSPTEEEIKKRIQWFNEEWKKLKEKEVEFEKNLNPPPSLNNNFFIASFKLLELIAKEGINLAESVAKDYFLKAPVVTEAGFIIQNFDGSSYNLEITQDIYKEEWKKIPSGEVFSISSPNGTYIAITTESDFGKIRVFEVNKEKVKLLFEVIGKPPFTFSPSGNYFAYRNESSIVVVDKEGNTIKTIPLIYKIAKKREHLGPVRIALSENHLGIISWIGIKIVDLKNGKEKEIRLKGGKSILFNKNGNKLYANNPGELFIYDLESLTLIKKLNYFYLKNRGVTDIHYLTSISPDERFIAFLYDPSSSNDESLIETSILVIYDLQKDKVIKKFEDLEGITSGLSGILLPASFSQDWNYLLLTRKANEIELLKIERF